MGIKEMELFHGAVLSKLFRNDRPMSLRMVEMNIDQSSRAYLVNDIAYIYVKHSATPRVLERIEDGYSWIFSFTSNHLAELQKLREFKDVYLALVCGQSTIDRDHPTEVCFINWSQITDCLDLQRADDTQPITVRYRKGYKLRVWGPKNTSQKPINVNQDALDRWEVPGV